MDDVNLFLLIKNFSLRNQYKKITKVMNSLKIKKMNKTQFRSKFLFIVSRNTTTERLRRHEPHTPQAFLPNVYYQKVYRDIF